MNVYTEYNRAYQKAVENITAFYCQHQSEDEEMVRDILFKKYREAGLDPDGKAVRYVFDVKCTADGLHSMWRITNMEMDVEQIVPVYARYRRVPIFFFPSEVGGINTTRAKTFGDRIDHTLYDLKMYFSDREKCLMSNAYNRPKTKVWLEGIQSFEHLIDWLGVKGIFTDDFYNVFDLEYADNEIIKEYRTLQEYQEPWSDVYYENLKSRIDMYVKGEIRE